MKIIKRRKYSVTCWDLDAVAKINIIKQVDSQTMKPNGEIVIEIVGKSGQTDVVTGEWSDDFLETFTTAFIGDHPKQPLQI